MSLGLIDSPRRQVPVVLLVSSLVLAGWSAHAASGASETIERVDTQLELLDLVEASNALVHEVQLERGATTLFLLDSPVTLTVQGQRAHTDDRYTTFTSKVAAVTRTAELDATLEDIESDLASLDDVRRQIDDQNLSVSEVLDFYSSLVANLLALEGLVVVLLKLHISLVYGVAAIMKLNPEFLSGDVLGRGLLRPDFLKTPELLVLLAWSTIAYEGGMAIALWVKRLRPWAIATGVSFNALIPLSMGLTGGLVVFSASIVGTYVLFLDRQEFAWLERLALQLTDTAGFPRVREEWMKPSN
jgi:hypothetical protein